MDIIYPTENELVSAASEIEWVSHSTVVAALATAFDNRVCSHAWLGYGNHLFIHFGTAIANSRKEAFSDPFTLESEYAFWRFTSPAGLQAVSWEVNWDDHVASEAMLQSIVGQRVVRYAVSPRLYYLDLRFGNGSKLSVKPFGDADSVKEAAWWIEPAEGSVVCVRCRAAPFRVDAKIAPCVWPIPRNDPDWTGLAVET